jgi:hypothetical protein
VFLHVYCNNEGFILGVKLLEKRLGLEECEKQLCGTYPREEGDHFRIADLEDPKGMIPENALQALPALLFMAAQDSELSRQMEDAMTGLIASGIRLGESEPIAR